MSIMFGLVVYGRDVAVAAVIIHMAFFYKPITTNVKESTMSMSPDWRRDTKAGYAPKLHIVEIIVGDGPSTFGYNLIGPGFDVGLERARQKYPHIFADDLMTITQIFTAGVYPSCEASAGEVIPNLFTLLPKNTAFDKKLNEFTIVLSPDCTTDILPMADFAREVDIPLIASTSAVPLTAPGRFPTLLPWSSSPLANGINAMIKLVQLYSWTELNLLCDDNPMMNPTIEVTRGLVMSFIRAKAPTVNLAVFYFDSSSAAASDNSFRRALAEARKHSTINVVASFPSVIQSLLGNAVSLSMTTGEYVFVLIPLSPYEQAKDVNWFASGSFGKVTPDLSSILPYVFALDFEDINWDRVSVELEEMQRISLERYNWTVTLEQQHSNQRLAAYESVLVIAEILNDLWSGLSNISAESFVQAFFNKEFHLPSRTMKISSAGLRVCDVEVKQFRVANQSLETVLVFEQNGLRLMSVNRSTILWPGVYAFPTNSRPLCRDLLGVRICERRDYNLTISLAVSLCLFGVVLSLTVAIILHRINANPKWWLLLSSDLQDSSMIHAPWVP
ncbi:hypothetical protein BV898_02356 [Hypsibius exemplaris]|uniref:Receptor ligand binding region domain-containing protein n=1 Tax=Hypsibius exemplaris TaxID=2072580 RepID=A0A1W0X8L5_HYPEX|nr:hypothetical protein BV898_02356 [Hypsibius exemplaris]